MGLTPQLSDVPVQATSESLSMWTTTEQARSLWSSTAGERDRMPRPSADGQRKVESLGQHSSLRFVEP